MSVYIYIHTYIHTYICFYIYICTCVCVCSRSAHLLLAVSNQLWDGPVDQDPDLEDSMDRTKHNKTLEGPHIYPVEWVLEPYG